MIAALQATPGEDLGLDGDDENTDDDAGDDHGTSHERPGEERT
jgi:hypothetical protein